MPETRPELQSFAARLASGPAFLLLGRSGADTAKYADGYRWSGVYTTRTDATVAARFRSEWRVTTPLGAMSATPARSQTALEVRYLFGGIDLPPSERPPTNPLEAADARMRCIQELVRLATETVTPRGVVVIDDWAPGDELRVDDLIPALRSLGPGQLHLFSAGVWADDPFVGSLAGTGQIVLHDESLDEAITNLSGSGALTVGNVGAERGSQHVVALGEGFTEIDIHTWNQVRRSARPIDLELLTPPVFSSEAARYQEYRNFAGATEGVPHWRGIAAGMNIRRDFEARLAADVTAALENPDLLAPVVLRGQTTTGKSVALAALAMDLARTGDWAVLHQSRRTARPALDDIDMYASWAEKNGAKATILIWDGMVDTDEYAALLRQLRSRGRKVLIVGSGYSSQDDDPASVNAPIEMTERELAQLLALLKSFGIDARSPGAAVDTSFLAFLYHTLPDSHFGLTRGLAHEMRAAEKGMEKLVRERGKRQSPRDRLTSMAAAFAAAGFDIGTLLPSAAPDEKPLIEQSFGERSQIQQVTALVLVASRHGVPVPIDLALRILGREGSRTIMDVLNSFDLIRDIEDDTGEYFLTIRSLLEAELLAQHEISVEVEVEIIIEVIRHVRINEGYIGVSDEVSFLVSLLDRLDAKSLDTRYHPHLGDISDALADRRLETGHLHPRLVLQESKLARGFVHWRQNQGHDTVEERIADLEFNRDLLDQILSDGTVRNMMRLSLMVELASTLGAITHEFLKQSEPATQAMTTGIVGRLDDILSTVLQARTIDPGNLHPVDVLAWSTRDAINTNALSLHQRLNYYTNAIAMIDAIDRSALSKGQSANLDRRGGELSRLVNNDKTLQHHLRNLEDNADPAAVYYLAKFEADAGPAGLAAALARLRAAPLEVREDWRCAQLLLELTWTEITGHGLFRGDRIPVHLAEADIDTFLTLAGDLRNTVLPDQYKLTFVKGLALFVAGRHSEARQAFREVEKMTRQLPRRIYTLVVLGDENGAPVHFTGRVEWVNDRVGEVWVNELRTSVHFEPGLFSRSQQFTKNQQLPAFNIGFKPTRGAVAEPRSLYREQRPR